MEITIKTMMIILIGIMTLVVVLAFLMQSSDSSSSMLDSLFSWFTGMMGG